MIGTPFDLKSVDLLEQVGIPAYKIGSPDFTNIPLMEKVASLGKPMIISTGMSTEYEIQAVIEKLNRWELIMPYSIATAPIQLQL